MEPHKEAAPLSLKDTLSFITKILTSWARRRTYGELTLKVQRGQVVVIVEQQTHRNALPQVIEDEQPLVVGQPKAASGPVRNLQTWRG